LRRERRRRKREIKKEKKGLQWKNEGRAAPPGNCGVGVKRIFFGGWGLYCQSKTSKIRISIKRKGRATMLTGLSQAPDVKSKRGPGSQASRPLLGSAQQGGGRQHKHT